MPLWGKTDNAANSVLYAVNQFAVTANASNQTAFFGNTSAWAANSKQVAGQFGVDSSEVRVGSGNVAIARISNAGSGYGANGTVTFTVTNGGSGAAANAQVGATGRVTTINITAAGSGYKTNPTIAISAPAAVNITANTTGVISATDFIAIATANSKFLAGDLVTYGVPTNNTAITGLTGNTQYYVAFSNTTGIVLSTTAGGANINITEARTGAGEVHTIQGETATGYVAVGGGQNKGATAGWNVRTAGTGGRAGRIQYECLVAMRNITSDASDDSILPDA